MEKELFSPMALDALGEMMNISLGSSATAVSNMLDRRVDITTPQVTVVKKSEFSLGKMEPAMGVEIKYVEGLDGSNIMLLKISDIKVIVDILMGSESSDEEFELNELTISCVCELMNQMMGAASTALSDFLGYPVNISTPEPFELEDMDSFKTDHMPQDADTVVVVKFALSIEDAALESGFMNVMSVSLARDLLSSFGLDLDGEATDAAPPPPPPAAPAPAPEPADAGGGGDRKMSQEEIERMLAGGVDQAPPPRLRPLRLLLLECRWANPSQGRCLRLRILPSRGWRGMPRDIWAILPCIIRPIPIPTHPRRSTNRRRLSPR